MAPTITMSKEWIQWHQENTFGGCKKSSPDLGPAAFTSLPIDQLRSVPTVWHRHTSNGWKSQASSSPPSFSLSHSPSPCLSLPPALPLLVRDSPRKRRDPSPKASPTKAHSISRSPKTRVPSVSQRQKAQDNNETGLVFALSALRDPASAPTVNNDTWRTIELWYALPRFDFRKAGAGRVLQAEKKRLKAQGTLQDHAFRPKIYAEREFTTLENLVNQRKVLETKRQILKYETAELVNHKKPAILPLLLDGEELILEEERLRGLNEGLAREVEELLEGAKAKEHSLSSSPERAKLPLRGVFATSPRDAASLATERSSSEGTPSEEDSTDQDPFERDLFEVTEVLSLSSGSSTSSEAAEAEAGGPQQPAPLTPQTSKHKAEAGDLQGATPKWQRAKPVWALKEVEPQPVGPQAPESERQKPMTEWVQRASGLFEVEGIDGPFFTKRF